jgi:hypothetical protein
MGISRLEIIQLASSLHVEYRTSRYSSRYLVDLRVPVHVAFLS